MDRRGVQRESQWMQYEWRADLARAELRMTKGMVIIAMGTIAIALLIAVPTLHGAAGLLFLAGTVVQMYAVAQM